MKISYLRCRTALSKSRLPEIDYALNPYRGCEHGCVYCYSPCVTHDGRKNAWGEYIDIKYNIPFVLSHELKKQSSRAVIGLGTVTDVYQPIEKKEELTRRCLEVLLKHNLPVSIQTKSALVERDIDILKRFTNCEVGFTITGLDDEKRKIFEPRASSIEERFRTAQRFADENIRVWFFIGPILPFFTDICLEPLVERIAQIRPKKLFVDRLRLRPGIISRLYTAVEQNFSEAHMRAFEQKIHDNSYFDRIIKKIFELCARHGLKCEPAFPAQIFRSCGKNYIY